MSGPMNSFQVADEGEDGDRGERRLDQRQHDVPVDAERTAPVEARRIFQIARDAFEELPEQEDVERGRDEARRSRAALSVLYQPSFCMMRNCGIIVTCAGSIIVASMSANADAAPRPLQPRERVGDERAAEQRADEIEDDEKQARCRRNARTGCNRA